MQRIPSTGVVATMAAAWLATLTLAQNPTWIDRFDNYTPGPLGGQGGWARWTDWATGIQGLDANIQFAGALSPPAALRLSPQSDVVYRFLPPITSGRWSIRMMTFVPSGTVIDRTIIAVLSAYVPSSVPGRNGRVDWGAQVLFDTRPNAFLTPNAVLDELSNPDPAQTPRFPIIRDQWVELRFEIDLDNDRLSQFYNGQPLGPQLRPYTTNAKIRGWGSTTPTRAIAGVTFYNGSPLTNAAPTMLIDDVSLTPLPAVGNCYANCDGSAGVPALTPADYICFLTRYRTGDLWANCDGSTQAPVLSPSDFICFLNKYRAGCP